MLGTESRRGSTTTWTRCRRSPGEPPPILPRKHVARTSGSLSSIDLGRGCPYQCSFCTIINVQGRKSRVRSADDLERIVRENYADGIKRFFITDDNFARNSDWEPLFDRLISMRVGEGMNIGFTIQVDTLCHKIPNFIEKATESRGAARLHRPRKHQPGQPGRCQEAPEQDHRIPRDAAEMAQSRRHHLRRLYPRLPSGHQGVDRARHRDHKTRTAHRHPGVLFPDATAWVGGPQGPTWTRGSGWIPT